MADAQVSVVITREQQQELDPLLDEVAYGGAAALDRIMAAYKLGRTHTAAGAVPKVKIVVAVEIAGEWVTPEVIGDTAVALADALAAKLNVAAGDVPITLGVTMDGPPGGGPGGAAQPGMFQSGLTDAARW